MSTAELQIDLINQITGITNKARLKELLQLLQFQNDEEIYVTNEEEKKAVSEARIEIKEGSVLSDEDFQKEINAWLNK
ncbi:MAG: hypothetical protein GXO46_14270 [Chlorobi bacterium]|uniref:hypothetical protein n=1 Tax=Chryseobacterium TaxID=59732 RepID=UPI000EED133B|nr:MULTISPECIES: hypothetical protein [Chryseobacterium]MCQ4142541.1 hypothetical protein [Chryseobacterium sp. EO14]NPA10145.1 hypothetical protein [Chlorobiota bacterium]WBX96442.1 hypothetical protein PE065_16540 [Chryseobacterium gambrini]HAO05637.1 hypothetical protein [Chryseobacterium sp.]